MMNALEHADLNRLAVDTDRFLGRVLLIGRDHERLPAGLEEALFAFLRAHTMSHARRHRQGLSMTRDTMEAGLRQGFLCIEEGLRLDADGDVERAIELLGQGDFESLRRAGWERLWTCLDQIRRGAQEVLGSPSLTILEEWRADLARWATIVPETWTAQTESADAVPVEPTQEYAEFLAVRERAQFLEGLPSASRRGLLEKWPANAEYSRFVRHLIAALALGCAELPLGAVDIRRFAEECFAPTGMLPAARLTVVEQVQQQLSALGPAGGVPNAGPALSNSEPAGGVHNADPAPSNSGPAVDAPDAEPRANAESRAVTVLRDVEDEMAHLEATAPEDRRALLALPRPRPGVVRRDDG